MLFDPPLPGFEYFQIHSCKVKNKSACNIVMWAVYPEVLVCLDALSSWILSLRSQSGGKVQTPPKFAIFWERETLDVFLQTGTLNSKSDFIATPKPLDRQPTSLCCKHFYFWPYNCQFGNIQTLLEGGKQHYFSKIIYFS